MIYIVAAAGIFLFLAAAFVLICALVYAFWPAKKPSIPIVQTQLQSPGLFSTGIVDGATGADREVQRRAANGIQELLLGLILKPQEPPKA